MFLTEGFEKIYEELESVDDYLPECNGYYRQNKLIIREGTTVLYGDMFQEDNTTVEVVLPNTLKTIGAWTFRNYRALEKINIPTSVTRIEEEAFLGVGLRKIEIPNSVTYIGPDAFNTQSNSSMRPTIIICEEGSVAEEYAKARRIPINYKGEAPVEKDLMNLFKRFAKVIEQKLASTNYFVVNEVDLVGGYFLNLDIYYKYKYNTHIKILRVRVSEDTGRWTIYKYKYNVGYYSGPFLRTNKYHEPESEREEVTGRGFKDFLKTFRELSWKFLNPDKDALDAGVQYKGLRIAYFYPELDNEFNI